MPKYIVTVKEVWDQIVEVEADNHDEAITLVKEGMGTEIPEAHEYHHTIGSDVWNVELLECSLTKT